MLAQRLKLKQTCHLMMPITIVFLAFCSIVHSFETVGSVFAQQLENGDSFSVMTDSILFVAEHVSWDA